MNASTHWQQNFEILLTQYSLQTSQNIILDVVLDWATLMVDSSGDTVPNYVARVVSSLTSHTFQQEKEWEDYIRLLYNCLMDIMRLPDITLSPINVDKAQNYLIQLRQKRQLQVQKSYPQDKTIAINRSTEVSSVANTFTEVMLNLPLQHAIRFFECVVITWLYHLPSEHVAGLRTQLEARPSNYLWSDNDIRCFAIESIIIMIQDRPSSTFRAFQPPLLQPKAVTQMDIIALVFQRLGRQLIESIRKPRK